MDFQPTGNIMCNKIPVKSSSVCILPEAQALHHEWLPPQCQRYLQQRFEDPTPYEEFIYTSNRQSLYLNNVTMVVDQIFVEIPLWSHTRSSYRLWLNCIQSMWIVEHRTVRKKGNYYSNFESSCGS